jgi:hypothetical protein
MAKDKVAAGRLYKILACQIGKGSNGDLNICHTHEYIRCDEHSAGKNILES